MKYGCFISTSNSTIDKLLNLEQNRGKYIVSIQDMYTFLTFKSIYTIECCSHTNSRYKYQQNVFDKYIRPKCLVVYQI